MSLDTVRTAIVATLNTVAGIGLVHRFERFADMQSDFRAFYETDGKVLGWFVRRKTTRETEASSLHNTVIHTWDIRGYMSLNDETETEVVFDTLIEAARTAVRNNPTLGGAVDTTVVDGKVGLQLDDSGPAMLSGVLCHSARLSLSTEGSIELGGTAEDNFETLHTDWDIPPHGNVTAPLPAAETDAEDLIKPEQDS